MIIPKINPPLTDQCRRSVHNELPKAQKAQSGQTFSNATMIIFQMEMDGELDGEKAHPRKTAQAKAIAHIPMMNSDTAAFHITSQGGQSGLASIASGAGELLRGGGSMKMTIQIASCF